jgi:hypothetical protein
MDLSRRPRHADGVRFHQFDNEVLLVHVENATGILLNETASLVWLLCDGARSAADIIELLRDSFPVAAERLPSEVEDALRLLSAHGAIEIE